MHFRKKYDKYFVIHNSFRFHSVTGESNALLSHCLAAVVEILQLTGEPARLRLIPLLEERARTHGRIQPAARIETGTEYKSDMICIDF